MTEPGIIEPINERTGRRWGRIALLIIILLLIPASWLARRAASRMEFFHLRAVAVEGTRYLEPETVVERLGVDTLRSVWDDTDPLAERLRSLPQVRDVAIRRRLPGTLVVSVTENLPVALAPSPRGLEPVDSSGVILPIDPSRGVLDLPVANQRDKSILTLLASLRSGNPMLYRRVSEVSRAGRDDLVLELTPLAELSTGVRVRVPMGVSVTRLADIFPVESDLVRRRANVAELDLRYRDQVIARLQ